MSEKNEVEKKNITVFGEETEFNGVLEFHDRLVITGKFSGKINAPEGDLEIAKNAVCKVDKIEAMDIDYPEDFEICNAIYKEILKNER